MHFQHSGAREFEQNTDIIKFWHFYSVNFASCQFLLKTLHGRKNITVFCFNLCKLLTWRILSAFLMSPLASLTKLFIPSSGTWTLKKKNDNNYYWFFKLLPLFSVSKERILLICIITLHDQNGHHYKLYNKNACQKLKNNTWQLKTWCKHTPLFWWHAQVVLSSVHCQEVQT